MRRCQLRAGFKLIELVIVLGIIGIVFAMIPVAVMKVREAANRSTCQNNLKQIGIAIHNYASSSRDKLPPMLDYTPGICWNPFWFSLIPYIESTPIFVRAYNKGAAWNAGNHAEIMKSYLCPSDSSYQDGRCTSGAVGWAGTSYAPVYQLFGTTNELDKTTKACITAGKYTIAVPDGIENQVAVVERFASLPAYNASNASFYPESHSYWGWNINGSVYGVWGLSVPQTNARFAGTRPAHPYSPSTAHAAMNALMLDGHVQPFRSSINPTTWRNLCTPDDGNPLGEF